MWGCGFGCFSVFRFSPWRKASVQGFWGAGKVEDGGEVSVRAGKSKTVVWMAFRWAKCEKNRNDSERVGNLREMVAECDVFCMRIS